jgi:opacity protein-like surface antigen
VDVTTVSNAVTNTTAGSGGSSRIGWTAGVGGEASLSRRISIGVEYRHSDFGSQNVLLATQDVQVSVPVYTAPAGINGAGAIPPKVTFGPTRLSFTDDVVTVRLNFRL